MKTIQINSAINLTFSITKKRISKNPILQKSLVLIMRILITEVARESLLISY